jgi:hypothetical protein
MKTFNRIAIYANLAFALGFAASGSFGLAVVNFVAAVSISAMSGERV